MKPKAVRRTAVTPSVRIILFAMTPLKRLSGIDYLSCHDLFLSTPVFGFDSRPKWKDSALNSVAIILAANSKVTWLSQFVNRDLVPRGIGLLRWVWMLVFLGRMPLWAVISRWFPRWFPRRSGGPPGSRRDASATGDRFGFGFFLGFRRLPKYRCRRHVYPLSSLP